MINTNGLNSEAAADYYESMAELIDSGTKDFLMELGLMNSTGAVKKFLNLNQSRRNAIEKKIRAKIINAADTTESAHKEGIIKFAETYNLVYLLRTKQEAFNMGVTESELVFKVNDIASFDESKEEDNDW